MSNHKAINDVRRKINEVMKNTDERIVVGWRPTFQHKRKEGEVWTDLEGKEWTVKNGVTQRVSKLEGANTPWWCPQCEKAMNHRHDVKFWRIKGKCMDCVIKEETEIKRQGKWQEYEQEKIKQNYVSALKDFIDELQDIHDTISKPEYIHADDEKILMIEKWDVDIDTIKKDIAEDIQYYKKILDAFENGETDEQVVTDSNES